MTEPKSLLPNNATDVERAVSLTNAARRPLPAHLVKYVDDPARCPLHLLDYLAWALSLDIWDSAWAEEKKRSVLARAFLLHRQKTTLAGIKSHVALVDCEVRKAVRPPARGFRVPALNDAAREDWLARLPQIRVFPYRAPVSAVGRWFHAAAKQFRSDGFRRKSQGRALISRRAVLHRDGKDTPVKIETVDGFGAVTVDRVLIAAENDRRSFRAVDFRGRGFRRPTSATLGVITMRFNEAGASVVTEGVRPVDVRPTRVSERHTAAVSRSYRGHAWHSRGFRRATDAADFIYDRIALHDASRLPAGLSARWFRGHKRYGIDPFTAKLTVEVPLTRERGRGFGRFRSGFRIPTDMRKLHRALEAIVVSKAFRDTILVDTVTHRVVRLSDAPRLGAFKLGEIRRVA